MELKLSVPQWHYSMLLDDERVSVFKEAIETSVKKGDTVFDLGTGSGILAMVAAKDAKKVYAVELDPITTEYTKRNITTNNFENIIVIESDATYYPFKEKADLVIAELLDTGLITEPQVPVLNSIIKRGLLKEGGIIIPKEVYNTAQIVAAKMNHIYYDEEVTSEKASNEVLYDTINFYKVNDEKVEYILKFEIPNDVKKPAIRLNTYTLLKDGLISGSSPMLNPPLVIPIKNNLNAGTVKIKLSYKMGGDLESIKVQVLK
ncbi:methyltransferase small [Methanococcus vannielii SB]|uniref:Methyltransferase small n=1 Tax=Methanococcus vannielii (strain ATCC 35089 / DSM 1224 / JCM 13029 / OCM 148 / SB) TaxID=406327 RepID=A6UQP6_METVS|nr:50S ribosomal protein L11 methyltransferase [Methanococcus vannielii]ABR54818.1 methyltransferase small [Methanococcus vannielii SB]